MKCPKCSTDNPDQAKFCNECGGKLEVVCPQCGTSNSPGSKFCNECGRDLRKPKEVRPIDYGEPQSYTPKHLADKILSIRTAVEGERKLVTILFADVADSTEMFENLDPEQVHEIMDGCFRILMDEIHRYEGTINQFTGDGVMALFGAPIAHEDHAQRACYASLAIQDSLRPYADRLKTEHGIDFTMRIGLNSGSVVVGAIGDDLRMDYTAQGDTANLAARMESNAEPGTVLVSEHTCKLAGGYFDFESLGVIQVKGKGEPVKTYQLIKPSEVATRIEASAAKGLTKFVGRKREMETLKDAFEKTRSGEGQVVGVVGEAGVGKSRLLLEFRNTLPKGEYIYLEGRSLHYGSSMPYLPILDAFSTYLGIKEGEQEPVIKQRMQERIVGSDDTLTRCLPPLQELFSVTVDDEEFVKLEPKEKREKTFEAIRDILIRGSQSRPIVWAVEDLHWIDRTTEEFLDYLIGWLPSARILLILLFRPEYTHQWGSKSYYSKVGVGQLSSGTSAELVQAILEGGAVVTELRELILSRASGNPLFIEELTHSLLENGSVHKQGDQYVLARASSDIQVPDTIQAIIAARMDRLEESLKRIMQVASVIGREFAFRILQAITEMKQDLKSNLLNLQGLEFIYEKSLFPELEYIFRHALTQEVAYNSLLLKRRKEIHHSIGQAIEELYPSRLEEFYEMLAYHYSKGGNLSKAYEYLKESANKAVRNDALFEGAQFYKEAMGCLSQLPQTEENKREQIDLVISMQAPVRRIGLSQDNLTMLQKTAVLAEEIGDDKKRMHLRSLLGFHYLMTGSDSQLAWKYLESCADHLEMIQDVELVASVGFDLCATCVVSGYYQRITRIAPTIIRLIEGSKTQAEFFGKPYQPYSFVLSFWGLSRAVSGDVQEGEHLCTRALSLALETDHRATVGFAECVYGFFLAFKGDGKDATEHLQNATKYLEESQTFVLLGQTWACLGYAHCFLGDYSTAVHLSEKGLRMHVDAGIGFWRSLCHWLCSFAHYEQGDRQKARTQAEEALHFSLEKNEKAWEGLSRIWLGRILAKTDATQAQGGEQQIVQGIRQLEELGLPLFYSWGYLWLGEVYAEAGRREEALENLQKAQSMFQEMGMDYWLGKAQVALARL
jgi:class 3 adenylate cyclase/tetratricopeptide (TPR) repeat protein